MNATLPDDWSKELSTEMDKEYFKQLMAFINHEYKQHKCYPPQDQIYKAFKETAFNQVKVVIIGQDPYHGAGQAHGLCFSVPDGVGHPPSLKNIFKELSNDLGITYPSSGNLQHWARQGVLLLNATLSVREGKAGSHQKQGWETYTDAVISLLSQKRDGIIFLLWGGFAKSKSKLIDTNKHVILASGHPSPLSANRGHWFGNSHFSTVNDLLVQQGKTAIEWGDENQPGQQLMFEIK